jgi:putative ABC transport system permease protein
MKKTDLTRHAFQNMKARKLRSLLTVISIMIGIAAVSSLISFGNGLTSYVDELSKQMGEDKIIIQPRGAMLGSPLDSNVGFDDDDLDVVRSVKGVSEATEMYANSGEIEFDDKKIYVFVMGLDFKNYQKLIEELFTIKMDSGQALQGDETSKVTLGHSFQVPKKLFDKQVRLGDKLKVNGENYKVKGFYEEVGNPQDDSNVYLTKKAYENLYGNGNYQYMVARAESGQNMDRLTEKIKEELRDHRNQGKGNEDFGVQTFEQVIETFNTIFGIISGVVVIIALISVIIAAVNIMNTMYTSVLERTKEIGIMKSIGATNKDIAYLFIFESGLLGIVGGAVGVSIGYLVAAAGGKAIAQAGFGMLQPAFTITLVIGCLVFAFLVGAISGLLPAKRASKMKPVDALRYE